MSDDTRERRLYRTMKGTCEAYELLAPGDRIMVCMSGGKDSYTLFELLVKLAARLPFAVELVAVHLDQRQPGYDGAPLEGWLRASGQRYEILSEDTYSVVMAKSAPGDTYCTVCSRLRRGILYSAAEKLGCNKLALGHHADDALETFLLNLQYAGKLQAMPARYRTDCDRFDVIRPLVECQERDIRVYAAARAFPILPCNLCGSQDGMRREAATQLLDTLERDNPNVRAVMLNALRNVRPSHLLDRDVQAAWAARAEGTRPEPKRARAEPAGPPPDGRMRLPIVSSSPKIS